MSARYKSPIGILFLLIEIASLLAMVYTLGFAFESALHIAALAAGVILLTFLSFVFVMVAQSWTGTVIAVIIALALTSPIFYYVWSVSGWPAGAFLCVSLIYATANTWRKDAEAEAD
jgi:hypothetical protein